MLNLLKMPGRLAGTLFAAALLAAGQGGAARPGAVNYIEGQVSLDGQALSQKSIGNTEVGPGQVLQTQDGKVEMLLTPGVFLRLNNNSAVKMVSPSLSDTRVELVKGAAMVEAAEVMKENHLTITENGVTTLLKKQGIYEFNASQPSVAVFDGEAQVQREDRNVDVGKGKEVLLTADNTKLKTQKFDRENTDMLYNWSKLRSEYMAEANMSSAQTIVVNNPGWWYGTGWYWNPYFDSWAFVPGDGLFYSPFGFGFFSPLYWSHYAPYYGFNRFGYGRGFYSGRAIVGRPGVGVQAGRVQAAPAARSFGGGGFRGGGGFGGGGFHGGGGRR
jgi:hypothetical protein